MEEQFPETCTHKLKRFSIASLPGEGESFKTLCALCGAPAHKVKICKCTKQPLASCASCGGTGKVKGIAQAICPCTNRAIADPNCSKCFGSSLYTGSEMRWAKLVPFNAGSSKQMMNYAKFRGYRIPMNSKRKIAMDSETVAKLAKSTGDPLYVHVQKHRVISKIKSSYADSWLEKLQNPSLLEVSNTNEGRALIVEEAEREWHARIKESGLATIHTSFQFRPATKQLSSKAPNIQVKPSTKHGGFKAELAQRFGEAVEAPAGHTLVEADFKSFHALTLGYEAGDSAYIRLARIDAHSFLCANMLHLQGAQDCLALPDDELREYLKYVKKNFEKERNSKAKPACIAEGSLVLTDQGLVPIERITLEHKLWDGVEWVLHDGVIDKGIREVITYDGLTATADHKIFLEDGSSCSFGEAASRMGRLLKTGDAQQAIRTVHGDKLRIEADRRRANYKCREQENISKDALPLRMWAREVGRFLYTQKWKNEWLRSLRTQESSIRRSAANVRKSLRCSLWKMRKSFGEALQGLRWTWNTDEVRESESFYRLHYQYASARNIQRSGDRSDRQQWTLRAWKYPTGDTQAADEQHTQEQRLDIDRFTFRRILDKTFTLARGLYSGCCKREHKAEEQGREQVSGVVKRSRVYDILNAGPRLCFTVNGVLAGNCLSYGFGVGARKLYDLNQDSFRDVEEAKYVIDMLNSCFPKCAAYRNDSPELAHRQMYLISPHRCIRWFCDVKKWNSEKQRWNHGKDWEKSIAFRPANIAFCVIQQRMIDMFNNGMAAKYNLINNIHDALLFCPKDKDLEQCAHDVKHLLELPDPTVTDPEGRALWCEVEVKAGKNWAKMQDLKI